MGPNSSYIKTLKTLPARHWQAADPANETAMDSAIFRRYP
jgi:hypothetical protein